MRGEVPGGGDAFPAEAVGGFGAVSRIAGYRLEQRIGTGGMAVVFRARDERLGRLVALKILAPALAADEAFRQRFVRESRAAAAVDDPHIIPVFEAGECDGVLFIAMRYVPGGDGRSLVRREGPLSASRAVAIISPVASALDAAHASGLVHRDVKPANMLIDSRPGRPDHVYLADFGLSKAQLSSATLSGAGVFMGTPAYMAPEQIDGRAVDGRTDQYALGCAAFELLTGEPPFVRDQETAVIYAQLSVPPPTLTSLRPGLPTGADGVLARALAKVPDDRYASCGEFADDLRRAFGFAAYEGQLGAAQGTHPPTRIVTPEAEGGADEGTPAGSPGGGAAMAAPGDTDLPAGQATVTSVTAPAGPGADGGHSDGNQRRGLLPPPWVRRRFPVVLAGIAVVVAAAVVAGVLLAGSAARASVGIAAKPSVPPLTGDSYVLFQGGNDARAQIHGVIKGAARGQVARLYAQPFPYSRAPARAGAVIVHPAGKTAKYAFQVTPSVATRYKVELFQSSTARSPLASSAASTIYVIAGHVIGNSQTCSRPVCHETLSLQTLVPASALNTEISKHVYWYFALNLSSGKAAASPKWLLLGAGDPHVTTPHRISATELGITVAFSFRVGNDAYSWGFTTCTQDTEAEDGIGLPGHHGCGDRRVLDSAPYVG